MEESRLGTRFICEVPPEAAVSDEGIREFLWAFLSGSRDLTPELQQARKDLCDGGRQGTRPHGRISTQTPESSRQDQIEDL